MTSIKARQEGTSLKGQEKIAYIRQMLGELRMSAKAEGADVLCYFLEMAYMEAGDIQAGRRPLKSIQVKGNEAAGMSG